MTAQVILNFDMIEEFSKILQILKDLDLEQKIQVKARPSKPVKEPIKPRQAVWGKGLFAYIAPEFDETPPGFEDYQTGTKSIS